jgi:hypothetical protein
VTSGQTRAELVARENRDAHLRQVLVAAGVIRVDVRVYHETDWTIGDLSDRRDDLLGERRELRVDHQDAVWTGQHADRAALTVERVEVAGDLRRLDLDLAEVRLRRRRRCRRILCGDRRGERQCCERHIVAPVLSRRARRSSRAPARG